jgi:hypothetical protein
LLTPGLLTPRLFPAVPFTLLLFPAVLFTLQRFTESSHMSSLFALSAFSLGGDPRLPFAVCLFVPLPGLVLPKLTTRILESLLDSSRLMCGRRRGTCPRLHHECK